MPSRRAAPWLVLWITVTAAAATAGDDRPAELAELEAAIRGLIEPQLQANAGVGFVSFACRVEAELGPGALFDCDAVDEDGTELTYTMAVDDQGVATVVLASQPASELTAEDLAVLEPPCRAFLDRFAAAQWDSLAADLHPSLLESPDGAEASTRLAATRAALGEPRSARPTRYAHHVSGRHELEYALDCANGPGVARFGVAADGDRLKVAFFTVRPAPGSALQAELLAAESRDMVANLIGAEVDRVDAPFDRLTGQGDGVDGVARLADGGELAIRVVQHGRGDDFDIIDYKVQMLELGWMIRRALAAGPDPSALVDCPVRVAPDGGSVTCRVELVSGDRVAVTVARNGGDHRIVDLKPVE